VPSCPSGDPPQVIRQDPKKNILTEEEMKLHDRQNILNALNRCGWEIAGSNGAAEILGIRSTTLHSKIKKMGIKRPD